MYEKKSPASLRDQAHKLLDELSDDSVTAFLHYISKNLNIEQEGEAE